MKRERETDELILNAPPAKKMKSSLFEDILNMAFRILEDVDDLDSDVERLLDEGYDW